MNSSMIVCAPSAKSPNCASQRAQGLGAGHGVPVLEPHGRVLRQQGVVHEEPRGAGVELLQRRVLPARVPVYQHGVPLPNVPRLESWPTRRTGRPSMTSAPNASSSPVAQSMTSPAAIAARRSSSGLSRGCTVRNEQLVGDRIEHLADPRLLRQSPRQIAVEKIGDPGGNENAERRPAHPGDLRPKQTASHGWHRRHPPVGQEVWHAPGQAWTSSC